MTTASSTTTRICYTAVDMSHETHSQYQGVQRDMLGNEFIKELQNPFEAKLFNALESDVATKRLSEQIHCWRQVGKITVFTSGVFDMLHPDHSGYLLHTKALGAPEAFQQFMPGEDWYSLNETQQQNFTKVALSRDMIRLVVGLRADTTTAITKGFDPSKGNSPRPIYSWSTRAFQLAKESYASPTRNNALLSTVDAVTIYGEHDFDEESPHYTHTALAAKLQPDVWAVFEESQDILQKAPQHPGLGSVALRYIVDQPGAHYFTDDVIGVLHTSSIVNRIKQT